MNSIAPNFSPISRFSLAKGVSVQAETSQAPAGDGFAKSQDAEIKNKNKVKVAILTTTAVATAAVLGTAAAVATAVLGPIVGGIWGAAATWAARDQMLPKYAVNQSDSSLIMGAKKVANLAIAVGASAFMGSCAATLSAAGIGPIVAAINGSSLGIRAGTDVGELIYSNIYDNKPLVAF
jgi:hypothetical protein